jgi:hypothetical protein
VKYLFAIVLLFTTPCYAEYKSTPNRFGGSNFYQNSRPYGYSTRNNTGSRSFYDSRNRMTYHSYKNSTGSTTIRKVR